MTKAWIDVRAQVIAASQDHGEHSAHAWAQRLVERRRAMGLTHPALARTLGISTAHLARIERGDLAHTDVACLQALAAALGGTLQLSMQFPDERLPLED